MGIVWIFSGGRGGHHRVLLELDFFGVLVAGGPSHWVLLDESMLKIKTGHYPRCLCCLCIDVLYELNDECVSRWTMLNPNE